ncbi:MAG: hypothetical protein RMA76_36805 [Deltaproteobacteria bacterium]|jgi:hypothetical protein
MHPRHTLPWLGLLAACGADPMTPSVTPPSGAATAVVRPTTVVDASLARTSIALPAELDGASIRHVATLGTATLVGGPAGLFEIGVDGLAAIDPTPVSGLTTLDGVGIVVATASGVSIWNGSLEPSGLGDALATMSVDALARRGDELWLATNAELYRFVDDALVAFTALRGHAVGTYNGASRILVETDGGYVALAEAPDGSWTTQTIDGVDAVVPGANDRIFGLLDGALFERVSVSADEVAWRPVALTDATEDPGAQGVTFTALDPVTGGVWFATASGYARLTGATVERLDVDVPGATSLLVSTDGTLFVTTDSTLERFGHDGPPVTWANDVKPFAEANCARCHVTLGIAHPLETYAAWVEEADLIIEEIAASRMPQDGAALVGGSAELIRRWKLGGFEE